MKSSFLSAHQADSAKYVRPTRKEVHKAGCTIFTHCEQWPQAVTWLRQLIDYNVHPVLVLTGGGDQVKAVSAHNAHTYHIITTHNRLIVPVYLDKVEPYYLLSTIHSGSKMKSHFLRLENDSLAQHSDRDLHEAK